MRFVVISRSFRVPAGGVNEVYLRIDGWNDFGFVTMFSVTVFDENGSRFELGNVKIGFVGQTTDVDTYTTLPNYFEGLSDDYFSVGIDVEYYRSLSENLSSSFREELLLAMQDVAFDSNSLERASSQDVFRKSLLRDVSMSAISGQFSRILRGGAPLTDFNFKFSRPISPTFGGVDLGFVVTASSTPSSNIHAIIGRNGVGKTTLLNEMIGAITQPESSEGAFYKPGFIKNTAIGPNYFSSLISVSFSAFDPFTPPNEQPDPELGTRYYYVGLKDNSDPSGKTLKTLQVLRDDCIKGLLECFSDPRKLRRWLNAIYTLESDENFAQMKLGELTVASGNELKTAAKNAIERMSSGHAIVLLTLSRLVAKVEEKTLVLLDEPESHLHPPLLSAFTRALSQLLHDRNGLAIIATHSPVVLQEVPRSCVAILTRSHQSLAATRPRIETFGENVGVLTREVFGLEVSKSGFHALLESAVREGKSYDLIISEYGEQLGLEARGILRAMIAERDGEFRSL